MDLLTGIEKVLEIKNWTSKKESSEVQLISDVYKQAFKKNLRISCGTCIIEAYFELKELYENKTMLTQKTMGQFELKKNKMIAVHGLNDVITSSNLTDEKAIKLLSKYPSHIESFEKYPDNWTELTSEKASIETGIDETDENEEVKTTEVKEKKKAGRPSKK